MGLDASVYRDDDEEDPIASVRLGNIALIFYLFEAISKKTPNARILLTKVLYSGSHCGDWLTTEEARQVKRELDEVSQTINGDMEVEAFISRFRGIVDVALQNDRPITF